MAAHDYAILVGITDYPNDKDLGTLKGPLNDVALVHEWLRDSKGGGLDENQIKEFKSPDPYPEKLEDPSKAPPTSETIEAEFRRIVETRKVKLKGRLYLYFAGHGFCSTDVNRFAEGAIYTANASRQYYDHVFGTQWARVATAKGLFEEIVLIMDCCRTTRVSRAPAMRPYEDWGEEGLAAQVRLLQIYAVPRGGKAKEDAIKERKEKVYGLLTHALIKALHEVRPTEQDGNMVTSTALKQHILQTWASVVGPGRAEPEIYSPPGKDILFRTQHERTEFRIVIKGSHPPGSTVIVRDDKLKVVGRFSATGDSREDLTSSAGPVTFSTREGATTLKLSMSPGLYECQLIGSDGSVTARSFKVDPAGGRVEIGTEAAARQLEGTLASNPELVLDCTLVLDCPSNPAAELVVVDGDFNVVKKGGPRLECTLQAGTYALKARVGDSQSETIVALRAQKEPHTFDLSAPELVTSIPEEGTDSDPEVLSPLSEQRADAAVTLCIRNTARASEREVLAGFQLLRVDGSLVQNFAASKQTDKREVPTGFQLLRADGSPAQNLDRPPAFVSRRVEVTAGPYVLCGGTSDSIYLPLQVPAGWSIQIYLALRTIAPGELRPDFADISYLFERFESKALTPKGWKEAETVRLALLRGRNPATGSAMKVLVSSPEPTSEAGPRYNPMLGLYVGHLLLQEDKVNLALLEQVIRYTESLLGYDYPDVVAPIGRARSAALLTKGRRRKSGKSWLSSLQGPPLLTMSWEALVSCAKVRGGRRAQKV